MPSRLTTSCLSLSPHLSCLLLTHTPRPPPLLQIGDNAELTEQECLDIGGVLFFISLFLSFSSMFQVCV
jgi:hypothetical protein